MADSSFSYPDANIDPRKKSYDWILAYVRASWGDCRSYTPSTMFYYGRQRMAEIKRYAMGKPSVNKFKKSQPNDKPIDKSGANIDWTPYTILPKFREIAISKILQKEYDTECYTIDPLAKSEEDAHFNEMKVKIMMRQMAEEAGSDLAKNPALMPNQGEAEDMEQLAMQQEYGYKHQMAMEGELGVSLIKSQNNMEELRKRTIENLFDYGIGGYKEWIDYNGMVKIREIVPDNLIISYCMKNDFSDLVHWGEVIFVSIADLSPYFTPEQLENIARNVAGKYGNPAQFPVTRTISQSFYKFKVAVLDFELITYNTTVFEQETDKNGNMRFRKTDFKKYKSTDTIINNKGQQEPKYMDTTRKVVYQTKWLIGTDMMYDWGISTNNKIKKSSWWETSLSCHLYSWNYYNMTFAGITERMIPIADAMCETWYRLQNLKAKLIPYLIKLDLNSLESTNFAKGGKNMTPADLVDFMMSDFVVLYRSTDLLSRNPNYDPAKIEATGQLALYKTLYEELQMLLQSMRDISGLNELTDGSTVNAKNLNSTNSGMMESTNNALYLISNADKQLLNKLSDGIIQRIQVAVKLGKVEGYTKALGKDTVRFYEINPNISNYELGIFTRPAPTQEERQQLMAELNLKDSQGLIDPSDKIIIMSCTNLKQAAELLAYKIKKRQEQMQQKELQKIQQQSQGNAQVAQMSEQMKQQTLQLDAQLKAQLLQMEKQWDFEIEKMKKTLDLTAEQTQVDGRTLGHEIQANAKVIAARVSAESHLAGTQIKGQADLLMTDMDNKTKIDTAEKSAAKKKTT